MPNIPPVIHRVVPEHTTDEVEGWWAATRAMHPAFDCRTWRDPLDPDQFPITRNCWDRCQSGAQLAGLVRLEVVWRYGGFYLDSDVEPYRPLDPLQWAPMVAAWEDSETVPDAVFGATPRHPALLACLRLAIDRIGSDSDDWKTGRGAWATGPGVFTSILPGRADVLLLPPGAFYPYHYTERRRADEDHRTASPWAWCAHRWAGSWLPTS